MRPTIASVLFCTSLIVSPVQAQEVTPQYGIAMHGDLKYRVDFQHFDYVNPDAPKGGDVHLADIGTFDSLNPYILKGEPPTGIGLLFDTLTAKSDDEAFSEYGLIAESIEVPADRSWVAYHLRPEARFADGSPVTADDVVWSLEILKTEGHPFYKSYFANVTKAEKLGPLYVRFTFSGGENRELPLIVGELPVLPKAWWANRDFSKTTLEPPLGSGPYEIAEVDAGRSITYRLRDNYWGKDLPVNKGRYNFASMRYDYYRDATVALEAFKSGDVDFRSENTAKVWATAYDFPALREGRAKKEEIANERPTGMQGFVFNTRRALFSDVRVREALNLLFDFEWTNANLFHGAYTRTDSYFSNSELASHGLPEGAELAILDAFRTQLPERVFNTEYKPPVSDGSGRIRSQQREALQLLQAAGWTLKDRKLINAESGQGFEFEILLVSPAFERIVLPFARNLERIGIAAKVRTVDATQYQQRLDDFDFDMIVGTFGQSLSPGNEQRDFWGSAVADTKGSRNLAGVHDPVVDALIDEVISAPDRNALIARTRALDRVLLWGFYVIPQWHNRVFRVAYWDKFGRPETTPKYALGFDAWWVKPQAP
ncbi:MAG: ABC transporter substrate-binding protein [Gammaproteobacteria bacterium]|nr:ABC transporter substrate-binding protein [Gammaproteobacteria bacterium]MCP5137888.1 ABC transporter substrate-binding protein [Gammaproteobacteria bacterium]